MSSSNSISHWSCSLPAMSVANGRSGLQPVYQPTTLPPDTRGRSYALPPTNPTGQTDTPRVLRICREEKYTTALTQAKHVQIHRFSNIQTSDNAVQQKETRDTPMQPVQGKSSQIKKRYCIIAHTRKD